MGEICNNGLVILIILFLAVICDINNSKNRTTDASPPKEKK